ncbi:DUF456 domain-containing protein [Chitinivorax sp. B]|uniref:DUF456 domain-containing protein n=1 Tax=Chitinivorax sp. B TaxID=2502235 RepID=UPI0010F44F34|nr:DUF456 domain-containing protein [Chitinivorax sp. B]
MDATTWWWLLAGALIVIGLAGNVLPLLPGTPVMLAGMGLGAWIDGFDKVGWGTLIVLTVLMILSQVIDFVAGSFGAQKAGASKQAVWGATIGAVVGIFGGLPGILLGPFVGALLGEYLVRKDMVRAGKVGAAAWVGVVLGMAAKVALGFTMLGIFILALVF